MVYRELNCSPCPRVLCLLWFPKMGRTINCTFKYNKIRLEVPGRGGMSSPEMIRVKV